MAADNKIILKAISNNFSVEINHWRMSRGIPQEILEHKLWLWTQKIVDIC